eukprot:TRINITY_DN73858_c0_g1_i1.p2 TRINITY_DN73858_c0_g1~~TRINITY_DN73858_c0_g1_i1.p2  ORF type:complete len:202 (+),score=46.44 TRINITY_DN73858_c0_g1_i1:81-608(+)
MNVADMDAADKAAIAAALAELGEEFDPSAGVQVFPRTDCPHLGACPALQSPPASLPETVREARCAQCGEDEVWLCGSCGVSLCSRYKNQHMVAHSKAEGHAVGLSLSDLSFWCFECDAYLDVYKIPALHALYAAAHTAKFGSPPSLPTTASASSAAAASSSAGPACSGAGSSSCG